MFAYSQMLVVRRSLTELLLEVTNEEIYNVAQEMLRKSKTKGSIYVAYSPKSLTDWEFT